MVIYVAKETFFESQKRSLEILLNLKLKDF